MSNLFAATRALLFCTACAFGSPAATPIRDHAVQKPDAITRAALLGAINDVIKSYDQIADDKAQREVTDDPAKKLAIWNSEKTEQLRQRRLFDDLISLTQSAYGIGPKSNTGYVQALTIWMAAGHGPRDSPLNGIRLSSTIRT